MRFYFPRGSGRCCSLLHLVGGLGNDGGSVQGVLLSHLGLDLGNDGAQVRDILEAS